MYTIYNPRTLLVLIIVLATGCLEARFPSLEEGTLVFSPEQLNLIPPKEGEADTISELVMTNLTDNTITISEWTLNESDELKELTLVETAPWDQDEVRLAAGVSATLRVIWTPKDNQADLADLIFETSLGQFRVSVSTATYAPPSVDVEVVEGGSTAGGSTAPIPDDGPINPNGGEIQLVAA